MTDPNALGDLALAAIENGNCVLLLGPLFARDAEGRKIHELLKTRLADGGFLTMSEFDNLFVLHALAPTPIEKMLVRNTIQKFYDSGVRPSDLYRKIARIPFKAIVSCTHDLFLNEAFLEHGIELDFQHYQIDAKYDDRKSDLPIVFNVFGSLTNPASLILTYEDFSDFVIFLLGDDSKMSNNLLKALQNAGLVILIGFDLEKWYYPLLIRRLKFFQDHKKKDDRPTALVNSENQASESYQEWQQNRPGEAGFEIISERSKRMFSPIHLEFWPSQTDQIIDSIYAALDKKGKLRTPRTPDEKARELIAQDRLEEALRELGSFFDARDPASRDVVTQSFSRLNRLRELEKTQQGALGEREKIRNEISQSILMLVNRLQDWLLQRRAA